MGNKQNEKNLPVTLNEAYFPPGRYIVSRTDLKGMTTYVNDTFVEVSGFSRAELMGEKADARNVDRQETRQATAAQSDAVRRIAAAVEELIASVHEIAGSAEAAQQTIEASHTLLARASKSMAESQSATASVVGTANAAGRTMAELSQSILADEVRRLAEKLSKQTIEIAASVRNTSNPTQFDAGYKVNVIPDSALGMVDSNTAATSEAA